MEFIGKILLIGLDIYMWIILINVIISWLIAFGVMNTRNPQAGNLMRLMEKATDPVFRPLRRFIPSIGGIDITPMVVIFGIMFLKNIVWQLFMV